MLRYCCLILMIGCQLEPLTEQASFHSQRDGKHTYLLTHYDVLPAKEIDRTGSGVELSNPFTRDIDLTDEELTIVRESFQRVGQCVYRVTSDQKLDTSDPQVFKQMLNDAEPLVANNAQLCSATLAKTGVCQQKPVTHTYAPLDQVLTEIKGVRELYAHRMPWYYDYLAMGLSFVILNGLFDIVTHNAQGALIKIAKDFIKSDAYRQGSAVTDTGKIRNKIHKAYHNNASTEELDKLLAELKRLERHEESQGGLTRFVNRLNEKYASGQRVQIELAKMDAGGRAEQFAKDSLTLATKIDPFYLKTAESEHKAEELFGRFLYIGRETKIFGKTVNLNPLWALKEGFGKKLVPFVKKYCTSYVALRWCLPIVVVSTGTMISAIVPFSTLWTGKVNSIVHREQEQRTLDDLLGDWDAMRTFSHVKPKVMSKLEDKMRHLATKGDQPCPPAKSLVSHYIDPQTGRLN